MKLIPLLIFFLLAPITGSTYLYAAAENIAKTKISHIQGNLFNKVDLQIQEDINQGFPGAVLLIAKDGKILKKQAYGFKMRYDEQGKPLAKPEPMTLDTLFDLASNTKIYATNFALMHLVYQGKLDINKPIKYYLPAYTGCDIEAIPQCRDDRKVKDLLMHSAGYMPTAGFYDPVKVSEIGSDLYSQDRDKTQQIILTRLPFIASRGGVPVYSDIDFMLLGILIEKITGQRLDHYVHNTIYKPLGLHHTLFNPDKFLPVTSCAATELMGNTHDGSYYFPHVRIHTLRCQAHDSKAYYSMAGIAGHAGLFSTIDDLYILLQVLLNNGRYGNTILWNKAVQDLFTAANPYDDSFGLGWRRSGSHHYFPFGHYAPANTIGHTGFTGTLTLFDKQHHLIIILLTNKIHSRFVNNTFIGNGYPTGHYEKISDLIYQALGIGMKTSQEVNVPSSQESLSN